MGDRVKIKITFQNGESKIFNCKPFLGVRDKTKQLRGYSDYELDGNHLSKERTSSGDFLKNK